MPYFRTRIRQDAYIYHEGVVEADTKEEAVDKTIDSWKGRSDEVKLVKGDSYGFDDGECDTDDLEEITKEQFEEEKPSV